MKFLICVTNVLYYYIMCCIYDDFKCVTCGVGVVHPSEQVRAFAAGLFTYLVQHACLPDHILGSRVVPAIVTLVSDSTV